MVTITNLNKARRAPMGDRGDRIFLVNPEMGAKHVDVHINVLRPTGPDGHYHYHPKNENIYIVLAGTGRFFCEGKEYMLQKDDVVFIPPGTKHSLSGRGDTEFVLIEIDAPSPRETINVD
ncbi:MAG: cupin domain-containing protein [Armatimonadetes bacterium]|nr:cupin domain-containing protein [Armatimonadota bacterium]